VYNKPSNIEDILVLIITKNGISIGLKNSLSTTYIKIIESQQDKNSITSELIIKYQLYPIIAM
jgi:hypothetical protein